MKKTIVGIFLIMLLSIAFSISINAAWSDGGYSTANTELNEIKNKITAQHGEYYKNRFDIILGEYPLSGYFNSKKTTACSYHCAKCGRAASTCISSFYDPETKLTVQLGASQCYGYARYCETKFFGHNAYTNSNKFCVVSLNSTSDTQLKSFFDNGIVPGTHIRVPGIHSYVYLTHDDNYIYFIDANSNAKSGYCTKDGDHFSGQCKIYLRRLTYKALREKGELKIYVHTNFIATATEVSKITKTNAIIKGRIDKTTGTSLTQHGVKIYLDSQCKGKVEAEVSQTPSSTYTNGKLVVLSYNIETEVKYILSPNTTYYCKIFAVIDGETKESNIISFTTSPGDSSTPQNPTSPTSSTSRYTVLSLDVSGSMAGTPLAKMKEASIKFCNDMLQANGNNYIAIVSYDTSARVVKQFTNNISELETTINNLRDGQYTNTEAGLNIAYNLLNEVSDNNAIKNIVLLSDGFPNEGKYISNGQYVYSDYSGYGYANAVYNTASTIKQDGYNLYTLGFFHDLSASSLTFACRFMEDLQNAGYHNVVDVNNLKFVFGEIANDISDDVINNNGYRIIRINCPVDVEVYDESGNLVASIYDNIPQENQNNDMPFFVSFFVNEDGEKLIYLPCDNNFNLKLIATGDGVMSVSVNEYCDELGEINRIINYYDIPISTGNTFTADIPKYSNDDMRNIKLNGTSTIYSLFDITGNLINSDIELFGDDSINAYYQINVISDNDEYGYVFGYGTRLLGSFALVSAEPFEGYKFDGWYVNDSKISEEQEYRFCVKSDVELIAKFVSVDEDNKNDEDTDILNPPPINKDDEIVNKQEQPRKIVVPVINHNSVLHNIHFRVNGGSTVFQRQVRHSDILIEPAEPIRKNHEFVGWYEDEECTKLYDFNRAVQFSFTLYAKWSIIND
jgi:Mg-chelatase subunit ChlD